MKRQRATDQCLSLLALVRHWWIAALIAAGAGAILLSGPTALKLLTPTTFTAGDVGSGKALAQLVPPGNTPDAVAVGRNMTVSWPQSLLTGGTPATGYHVRRYNPSNVSQTILSACDATVTALACTENDVPFGSWRYSVTPVFNTWTGTEGLKSAAAVTSSATLTLPTTPIPTVSLPATLNGSVAGFLNGEALTFHLDDEAGPVLTGTPATVPAGGSTAITVTIPAGTNDSAHSVFAVGDGGTLASHAVNVIDPPRLTTMEAFDTNANGKVDQVVATFSETLATYTAGTSPWTLNNVPSGGTLASVSVSGAAATLTLAEGGGAADTTVGSFSVALASDAAGIRDLGAQASSFAATAVADKAAPVVIARQMFDANANGRIDRVTVAFSETLATDTAGITPWTLNSVPSGGSLLSVAATGTTATLTLTEGAGAPNTAVGSFTVALATNSGGMRDAVGNLSSFAATAPVDMAAPVRVSMVMNDVNGNGKVDQVLVTTSESLATYTAGNTPWSFASVPSAGTINSVAVSGTTATLTFNEGAGAVSTVVGSFTVTLTVNAAGIRDAAGNMSSWSSIAPADGAKPVIVSLNMNDVSLNGKVDQVTAVYTETLGSSPAPTVAPWTLTGVPSGGTLTSVSVATTTATLTIAEGAGAADTTVGSFTLALAATTGAVQDPFGNLASFSTRAPLDTAKPGRVSMVMNDVNGNGKVDQVAMTFSETLSTYTAPNTVWTLASAPSSATLASVSVAGTTATLNLNEGAGAISTVIGSFKITLAANAAGIRDAANNQTSWASTAPTDGAKPLLVSLNMNDANANGKVDQITAVFTETLGGYTAAIAPWTLTGVPSGGTLASVSVATTTATLTIAEGAGTADTTVGSLTVAMASDPLGVKDTAGNVAVAIPATVPLDKAKPGRVSMVMNDVDANGKVDQVAMTFSETLSTYTAGLAPWALASAPSGATLSSVSVSGTTATLNLAEGAGAPTTAIGSFKIALTASAAGIRDAAGNQTAWTTTGPTDGAKPVLVSLTMTDTTLNGKVDHATATFSETLSAYTAANTPWTLAAVPSNGTILSVTVSAAVATINLNEGAGAADTTTGAFTIAMATNVGGVRDAAGNLASFAATAPADKAAPARLTMLMNDTDSNGKVDQLAMTFSEPLDTYTAGSAPWTLAVAPSGATFGSVTTSGSTATLTLVEGAAGANTAVGTFTVALTANAAGIRDVAANNTAWVAIAPTDGAKPVLVSLTMTDTSLNGKVDHATAIFSETLSAYTAANTPWTLTGVPSNGTILSVTVATTTVTINLTEGAGAADTTVGAFTIAMAANAGGVRDAAGNLASFATAVPADKAAPIRISMLMNDTNSNGKVDQVAMTFSEPLDTYTAGATPWTLVSAPSGATFAAVTTSAATATMTLTEGAGAASTAVGSFTVAMTTNATGIRDAAANAAPTVAAVAPTDHAAPALISLTMTDTNANGKVDRAIAVFSETSSAYTAGNTPWTLTGVPSGGTLASVAVATTTATLTITEGAGAPDTAVGSFTVAMAANALGVRDALNQSSFAATAPIDGAAPVRQSIVMRDVNANGKVDQVVATYSESLGTYSAGTTPWTLVSAPSGATLGSVATSGAVATVTLTEGAGAASTAVGAFTVAMTTNATGVRDAAGNAAATVAAVAPIDGAAPALVSMAMTDGNANGKVDGVTATFSETLASYTAGSTPWTLSGVPSGGTLASVAGSGAVATLTIAEGPLAEDTSVGSFTVALASSATGVRDVAANLSSFGATAPADGAAPVAISLSSTGGTTVGTIEAGDTLQITFSEPLAPVSVPSIVTVTEADPVGAGNDTLAISGITNGARNTGSDSYITLDGGSANFASSSVALTGGNRIVTVTVGGTCTGTACAATGQGLSGAPLSFAPASALTDTTGVPAAGTRSVSLVLF